MDCFVTCIPDATDICAMEIKELIGKDAKPVSGACIVSDVSAHDLATLSFRCQSAFRVGVLLAHTKAENLDQKSITPVV